MNEAEKDMKNYADRGGCYLQNLHNSLYPMKTESVNCFIIIIHSK